MLLLVAASGCGGETVKPLMGARAITAGGSHACALMTDGTARCWGDNLFGELGASVDAGAPNDSVTPVASSLPGIVQLSAGGQHTCALLADASLSCWGANFFGQLGTGVPSQWERPTAVVGVTAAMSVTATGQSLNGREFTDQYSCALLAGGTVSCWGQDSNGEIGNGTMQLWVAMPSPVSGVAGATGLGLGGERVYAVLGDATVASWGYDILFGSETPVAIPGLTDVVSVAAGELHACALHADGTVSCWGTNDWGQLGDGSTTTPAMETPQTVAGLAGVTAISAGADHTCALLSDGTVRCWGSNGSGQLGDGFKASIEPSPTSVSEIASAVAISAGEEFTCALLADSTVECWGANDSGQLGNGAASTADVGTPVSVVAGS